MFGGKIYTSGCCLQYRSAMHQQHNTVYQNPCTLKYKNMTLHSNGDQQHSWSRMADHCKYGMGMNMGVAVLLQEFIVILIPKQLVENLGEI